MNDFEIFVDSSANLTDEQVGKYDIKVISYCYSENGKETLCYEAGGNFVESAKSFYAKMRNGANYKTSLVGYGKIYDAVEPVLKSGRNAIMITIAAGISGTYNEAVKVKADLERLYKGRKFFVCDSANASLGQGLQALKVADLRAMGESAESCAEWVANNAYRINSYLTVGDLKYLRRGGRISTAVAIAGTLLNIKPIIRADGGTPAKLAFFSKERGRKKAIARLVKSFKENAEDVGNTPVAIAHADCEEDALELAGMLRELGVNDIIINWYDLCTGSHVGPGTVALFFYGKDRRPNVAAASEKAKGKVAAAKI